MPIYSLHFFASEADARAYRHKHGTGGWIFAGLIIVLFPPSVTPNEIFSHPITRGLTGKLVGNG